MPIIENWDRRKAREILDSMSSRRIDPSRIKFEETGPRAKGGQSMIFVATISLPAPFAKLLKMKVAVKKLEWNREDAEASSKFFKSFVYQLSLMMASGHPNIIRLIGFVEDMEKGDAWLIIPWEANGNVREFLASGDWDIPERVSLIQDAVNGLEYLHTRQPPICHGDLKSLNILVDDFYRAVITDFESARAKGTVDAAEETDIHSEPPRQTNIDDLIQEFIYPTIKFDDSTLDLTLTGACYSLRWTAPEVLRGGPGAQDLRSDMWSIGWVCWEIFTGKIPFEELRTESVVISNVIKGKVPAIRGEADLSHVPQLCSLIMDCWMSNPVNRIDVSTFRRKVRFVPSITPSADRSGGAKVRSADLLLELGRMYGLQNDTVIAESHYQSAIEVAARTKDDGARANALNGLGGVYSDQSRCHEAEEAFTEAQEIHSRIGNDRGAADALNGLGGVYGDQSRCREAEKAFTEAHEIHSRIGNDRGAADALNGLGGVYGDQSRCREAEKAFAEAHEIHSRIGNDRGAADALNGLGGVYGDQSRCREAEKAFADAHEIHSRIGNDRGAAEAWNGLGGVYGDQSRCREAEKAFADAHEIHSRIGNDRGAADALNGLGGVYGDQSRCREAEKAFADAHEIHSRIGNDRGAADALNGLGGVYSDQSRYREAEKAFTEAHKIHSRIGNERGAADALKGLGDAYSAQSKYPEAEETIVIAWEINSRIGNDCGVAGASVGLGEIYYAQSRYSEAEEIFTRAHEIHSRIGNERGVADASVGLGEIYNAQSRYSEAEEILTRAHEIHSRIGNERGGADALTGLGEAYSNPGRYHEAEKALVEAYEIYSRIGNDRGAADALNGLGGVYGDQSRYREAEKALMEAHEIHSRIGNDRGAADALNGLGGVYGDQSRYRGAEKAFMEAHEIHSCIGNERGGGNALIGLGKVYRAHSRYVEAEKAFREAGEIHSRIGNGFGVGNALISLGGTYDAQSRDSEAEKSFIEAHKIHSRIGTCIGTATALIALGNTYDAQSRDSEAEQAYRDALKILSRIDNGPRARNVPNDLEDISDGEQWDPEDEEMRKKASGIHSRTPTETRTGNEQEDEEQPREIPPAEPRNVYEIGTTPATSSFDEGTSASNDPESESLPVPSTPVYKAAKASLPEPSSPLCSPQTSATLHDTPYLLQLSSRLTYQASASPQLASVADPAFHDDQQERFLTEQLAMINYVPAPATEELVDLLQVLGRAAPQAVRNKHKIYSILRVVHDTRNYIVETGNPSGDQKDTDINHLLDRMEKYGVVLDALEEILLEFAEILPSEITVFGPELYSSWLQSQSIFAGILNRLCHPPFPAISYKTHDIAEDSFFDDCSWLSRLLYGGIDAEVAVQFPDPPVAHPVLAVTNGLHHLVSQIKYGTQNEQTRELVLDIATLLARTLAATSPNYDGQIRQREPSPTTADRDWLIQGLADSFSILDLDAALEASTTQELVSKWTEIKTSLTSRGMSALEK